MEIRTAATVVAIMCASSVAAQAASTEEVVFAEALHHVRQHLVSAPPLSFGQKGPTRESSISAIAVARRTLGGAPPRFRSFANANFGVAIAEELVESYGDSGPAARDIQQASTGTYTILPLEEFEVGPPLHYDWQRLNQRYPEVRHVVRISWPVVDRTGTLAVVGYELIGRDRPASAGTTRRWQHTSFVEFEKQPNGSWKPGTSVIYGGRHWD